MSPRMPPGGPLLGRPPALSHRRILRDTRVGGRAHAFLRPNNTGSAQMTKKTAIVTGGGSGLGEAIAKALAGRGVNVVLADIDLKGAERVARDIRASGGTASAIHQDVAQPEDSETVIKHALDTYGGLHYAVNNAGIG